MAKRKNNRNIKSNFFTDQQKEKELNKLRKELIKPTFKKNYRKNKFDK